MIVLSHFQIEPLLLARNEGKTFAPVSLDLGMSSSRVEWNDDSVRFPDLPTFLSLTWHDAEKIAASENSCFVLDANGLRKIQTFSETTNRAISLYPTRRAPTLLIGGIPMHRVKDTDPYADTLAKIKSVAPIRGRVLDTCTGLGYTAVQAARTAEHVITIEHDPGVVEIARLNPWSHELFDQPRIERLSGDAFDLVPTFQPSTFDVIIHDPPMFNLAGDLYSQDFYRDLHRVLARGGKIFHYIGDLDSKSGRNVLRGVMERLQAVGFKRVVKRPEAFGVVAQK